MTRGGLRIALIGLTHPFRGGIAHHTSLLCRALRQRHQVRFFTLSRQYPGLLFPGETQRDLSRHPFRVAHEATIDSLNPATWLLTAGRIRRFGPDLVLVAWWHPFFAPAFGTIARLAGRPGRIPVCFLCHNVLPHEPAWLDRLLLGYAFSPGASFLVHSRSDAEQVLGLRPAARVIQQAHPIYSEFLPKRPISRESARAALGLRADRVVLFFGFIREYKGLGCLLEAFAQLDPGQGHHLVVAGEFYQGKARYAGLLASLAERGQLTLVDRYVPNEQVPTFFSAADVVVTPYLSATQSGVVQLAYAFARPVIATPVGGLPELVQEGRTGFLVPPGDAAALAAAIRRIFEPGAVEALAAGIERLRQECTWERLVDAVEQAAAGR